MQNKCCFAEKFFHFAHLALENYEELGLSEDAVKKIRELKIGTKKSLIRNRAEAELLMVDVISKLHMEKPEISEINRLIDKKFDVKKAGMKKLIASFVAVKKLLSKEQIKQIKAICKSESHSQSKEGQCRR